MPHTGLSDSAPNVSQIIPLSEGQPSIKSWEIHPHFDDDPEPRPNVKPSPELENPQDEINRLHLLIHQQEALIKRQADQMKIQTRALDNVATFLYRAFSHDEWGTRGSFRRLISMMFGARDYKGSDG
ncbi:MAG: hypothetical protein O7B35_18925 [Deltaproteobacteria bacterium]|nr:hypothetical protein [Deltaproteobacteria bacterium]